MDGFIQLLIFCFEHEPQWLPQHIHCSGSCPRGLINSHGARNMGGELADSTVTCLLTSAIAYFSHATARGMVVLRWIEFHVRVDSLPRSVDRKMEEASSELPAYQAEVYPAITPRDGVFSWQSFAEDADISDDEPPDYYSVASPPYFDTPPAYSVVVPMPQTDVPRHQCSIRRIVKRGVLIMYLRETAAHSVLTDMAM